MFTLQKNTQIDAVFTMDVFGWHIALRNVSAPVINIMGGCWMGLADSIYKGHDSIKYMYTKYWLGQFEKLSCMNKYVISNSDFVKKNIKNYYGVDSEVINSGIDPESMRPILKNKARELLGLPMEPVIGIFVGQPTYAKGFDIILSLSSIFKKDLFMNEIKPESVTDEIQEVNFRESRILYDRMGRLSVIAITKKTNLQAERGILRQVMEDFYFKFESAIKNFNGNIDPSILQYKKRLENINLNELFKFDNHL